MAEPVICGLCSAKVKEGLFRCPRCGHPLSAAAVDSLPPAPVVPANRRWLIAGAAIAGLVLVAFVIMRPSGGSGGSAAAPATTVAPMRASRPAALPKPRLDAVPGLERPFLDPDRAGNAAYATGDLSRALAEYQKAIAKDPSDAMSLNNLGQVLVRAGRATEAIQYFNRAIELNPSVWAPRFNLARAYGELGDLTRAIAEYRAAAAVLPDDYVTQYNLGRALHSAGQEESAITAYQSAIQLAPGEPSFRLALGISYEKLKKSEEAAAAYGEYLALAPDAADAQKIKTRIQQLRGQETPAAPAA